MISACIIARDEAGNLPRCLASLRGRVDECLVVDTGSVDDTIQLARAAGARVLQHPWSGDFAEARNVALSAAEGDWILSIDADEELTGGQEAALRDCTQQEAVQGWILTLRNLQPPGSGARFVDTHALRLFRAHPEHRFEGRIHESVSPSLRRRGLCVEAAPVVLLHHGYAQAAVQGGESRHARNLLLLKEALQQSPDDCYLRFHLGRTLKALGDHSAASESLVTVLRAQAQQPLLSAYDEALAWLSLSQMDLQAGQNQAALGKAERALELDSGLVPALQVAAVAAASLGSWGAALSWTQRLLSSGNLQEELRQQAELLRGLCVQQLGGAQG